MPTTPSNPHAQPAGPPQRAPQLTIAPGCGSALALFAYDIGVAIDLDRAEHLIQQSPGETLQRETIKRSRRTPQYFQFRPSPLRLDQEGESIVVGTRKTLPRVECTLFSFGAVSVTYTVPIDGPLSGLLDLSAALYENAALLEDSRKRVREVLRRLGPAVRRPGLAPIVEDYVVYRIERCDPTIEVSDPLADASTRHTVTQLLRAEEGRLSVSEVDEAVSARISFGPTDTTIIDWNAALLIGPDNDDALAVLEFANVELLEMRFIDDRLDAMLDQEYETHLAREQQEATSWWRRQRRLWHGGDTSSLRRLGALQMDNALLFEGINNALKLLGDQYLARLYRLAAARLHLPAWDASILRKLQTLDGIYQKIADQRASWRMEVLELIVILLIAAELVIPIMLALRR